MTTNSEQDSLRADADLYQRIVTAVVSRIREEWSSAAAEVIFFPQSTQYEAEYALKDGRIRSSDIAEDGWLAVNDLRRRFQERGDPVWGQIKVEISDDQSFRVALGYEKCDSQGNTVMTDEEWLQRQREIRLRHRNSCLQNPATKQTAKPPSATDISPLLAQSMEELRLKTAVHEKTWHLGECRWSVDQNEGVIRFTAPDGIVATCPVQIIGTFNTQDSTWIWGWDHPAVLPGCSEHAKRVFEYGEQHHISDLTTRKLSTNEDRCWEWTALACKLNDAQGAYRGPSGPALVYMTFGTPTLSKTAK